jgi:hypothetical protein
MVINDLDATCPACSPDKTDSPLIVDSNAVLAFASAFKGLQSIARRNFQVRQRIRPIQLLKLSQGGPFEVLPPRNAVPPK